MIKTMEEVIKNSELYHVHYPRDNYIDLLINNLRDAGYIHKSEIKYPEVDNKFDSRYVQGFNQAIQETNKLNE